MSRREDSDLIISAWSPEWIDGSGTSKLSEFLLGEPHGWRTVETLEIPTNIANQDFDSLRYSGEALARHDQQLGHEGFITVACELTRLRAERRGPRAQCVAEHAVSTVACPLGLHSIDLRFNVPEAAFQPGRNRKPHEAARDILSTFRGLCEVFSPAWAACLTFGRGPSIAELYKQKDSITVFGALYLSNGVSARHLAELSNKAPSRASSSGIEFSLSPIFGGPSGVDENETFPLLRSAMRQASLPHVPWEMLSRLDQR